MLSPRLEILEMSVAFLGVCPCEDEKMTADEYLWQVRVGIANTGFLPTHITAHATKIKAVLPLYVELSSSDSSIRSFPDSAPLRIELGQLCGRLSNRIDW
jgi:hypothetical protein